MFNKRSHFSDYIKDWYNPVEYDLKLYEKILQEVNKYNFTNLTRCASFELPKIYE